MVRPLAVFAFFSAIVSVLGTAKAQSNEILPSLSGYVTRVSSPSDFDVSGLRVILDKKTQIMQGSVDIYAPRRSGGEAYFGECVDLYGKVDRKQHRVEAEKVVFCKFEPEVLSGIAVIDRIIHPVVQGNLTVRADGYPIQIHPSTQIVYTASLASLSDIQPNIWIKYRGTRGSDGIIVADTVVLLPNSVSNRERKLHENSEYDPSAVPADSRQNAINKYLLGPDPKRIPPYSDPVMQARIERIGSSLIPRYQRNLSPDNPSKISFRFQLIDNAKLLDALTLPNGIILIPRQVVERLPDDSQLATVLADNLATALEKQRYRLDPAYHTMTATGVAAAAGGALVPGLGLASLAANHFSRKSIQTNLIEQSGRVSIGLLHDAGYDIRQAPVAWWILSTKLSQPLSDSMPPPRAINLYRTIGLIWENYPSGSKPIEQNILP